MMKRKIKFIFASLIIVFASSCISHKKNANPASENTNNQSTKKNKQTSQKDVMQRSTQRAIEVIKKSRGVFIYKYTGNYILRPLEPYSDFADKREITNAEVISQIKTLIEENKKFEPDYKKRCLPKWKYGLEFRKTKTESKMILFSFDCSTMMIYEEKVYKDFEPQKIRLYGLLNYEINSSTSRPVQKQQ